MVDQQTHWDLEDATQFRRHLHELHQALCQAEEQETKCRGEYAKARHVTLEARAKLAAAIEADCRGLPLIEFGARQAAENGDGHKPLAGGRAALHAIPVAEIRELKLGKILTEKLKGAGYGTIGQLVELAWSIAKPLAIALQTTDGILYEDCLKVQCRVAEWLEKPKNWPAGNLPERHCVVCKCSSDYCPSCIVRTGEPCHWIDKDRCSACASTVNGKVKEKAHV